MYANGGDPSQIMTDLGLEQLDNEAELVEIIDEILAKNSQQVADYRQGKQNVLQYLIGQVMAVTKGKANPGKTAEILKEKLKS